MGAIIELATKMEVLEESTFYSDVVERHEFVAHRIPGCATGDSVSGRFLRRFWELRLPRNLPECVVILKSGAGRGRFGRQRDDPPVDLVADRAHVLAVLARWTVQFGHGLYRCGVDRVRRGGTG
jgi:hypothetical protein